MPPGEFTREHLGRAAQPDGLQLEQHNPANQGFGQIRVFAQWQSDIVETGQIGEQGTVLQQHADILAHAIQRPAGQGVDRFSVDHDLSLVRSQLPGNQTHDGGLAGTAGTH